MYLPSCEVSLIEVLEIMAQMGPYIIFLSLKPKKMTSDFILSYLAPPLRNIKNKYKNHYIFTMDAPQGVSGVSINPEDQTEDHSEEFQPKLNTIRKTIRKQKFLR